MLNDNQACIEWSQNQSIASMVTCVGDGHDGVWNLIEQMVDFHPDQIKQQCSSSIESLANTLNEQTPTLDIGWKTDTDWIGQLGKAVLGWLLSAIAIAMGPPFLFDVLNRFMNVRNAAKPILPSSQNNSST